MIENIIFYSIMIFFSLVGMGAAWNVRYVYKAYIPIIVFGVPVAIGVVYQYQPEYLWFLDITKLLPFSTVPYSDPDHAIKNIFHGRVFMAVLFGIVFYFVTFFRFLFLLKMHVTNTKSS